MDTILSSLNALVEKLGGDTTDNKLIVDALNDISAKYGGDSDNKLIVDALNDIVDNYSGSGDNCDIRRITLVNNREGSTNPCTMYRLQDQDGTKRMFSKAVGGGSTEVFEVAAPRYYSSTDDYGKQWLVIMTKSTFAEPVIDSAVATTIGHIVSGTYRYTIIETVRGSKDITLTIA